MTSAAAAKSAPLAPGAAGNGAGAGSTTADPVPGGPAKPDKPPKATGPAPAGRGRGRPTKTDKRAERTEKLATDFAALGAALVLISPLDGIAVATHAGHVATALAQLAEQNALVARLLDGASSGGVWFGVLAAMAPLLVELLANHGMLGQASAAFATPAPEGAAPVPGSPLAGLLGDLAGAAA